MFYNEQKFNADISGWNTSSVTIMSGMFVGAYEFNQPIGNWDVSKVTTMQYMFADARKFDQPIGDWDVSSVYHMGSMFHCTAWARSISRSGTGTCPRSQYAKHVL